MRKSASFLAAFLTFALSACASAAPPEAATPAASNSEPAPPAAPPPPPADLAPPASPTLPTPAVNVADNPSALPAAADSGGGANDCKLATKGDSPVAKACREGGVKAAKATMKDLVKKAKDHGAKFRCDDCHKDPQDFTKLAPDARKRFDDLVAAANK